MKRRKVLAGLGFATGFGITALLDPSENQDERNGRGSKTPTETPTATEQPPTAAPGKLPVWDANNKVLDDLEESEIEDQVNDWVDEIPGSRRVNDYRNSSFRNKDDYEDAREQFRDLRNESWFTENPDDYEDGFRLSRNIAIADRSDNRVRINGRTYLEADGTRTVRNEWGNLDFSEFIEERLERLRDSDRDSLNLDFSKHFEFEGIQPNNLSVSNLYKAAKNSNILFRDADRRYGGGEPQIDFDIDDEADDLRDKKDEVDRALKNFDRALDAIHNYAEDNWEEIREWDGDIREILSEGTEEITLEKYDESDLRYLLSSGYDGEEDLDSINLESAGNSVRRKRDQFSNLYLGTLNDALAAGIESAILDYAIRQTEEEADFEFADDDDRRRDRKRDKKYTDTPEWDDGYDGDGKGPVDNDDDDDDDDDYDDRTETPDDRTPKPKRDDLGNFYLGAGAGDKGEIDKLYRSDKISDSLKNKIFGAIRDYAQEFEEEPLDIYDLVDEDLSSGSPGGAEINNISGEGDGTFLTVGFRDSSGEDHYMNERPETGRIIDLTRSEYREVQRFDN